jgi:hypothetical protein
MLRWDANYFFMKILFLHCVMLFCAFTAISQTTNTFINSQTDSKLKFSIGKEVVNANDENEKEIIALWKNYIMNGEHGDTASPYWWYGNSKKPDSYLSVFPVTEIKHAELPFVFHCQIIGIFSVENGYYCLKSAFMHKKEEELVLDAIVSVYAKKIDGQFLLVNSTTYYKSVLEHHKVGSINYYVHPFHKFDKKKADKMRAENNKFAQLFDTLPLQFDYYVANTSREITQIWGYDFMDRMYRPEQSGGVALVGEQIVLAGNNSEYYPHELFHLYAYNVAQNLPYFMINEGIATYFTGSTALPFEWHLQELKDFDKLQPNYDYWNIDQLKDYDIPNGKHKTDLRYIVGAIIARAVYEKDGFKGVKELLKIGQNKEDMLLFMEQNLKLTKGGFNAFITAELKK